MVSCAACGCTKNQKSTSQNITFHHFPKDESRRQKWLNVISSADCVLKRSSVLCSQHFTDDCFDRTSLCIVRLKPAAVPTIHVSRLKYARTYNPVVKQSISDMSVAVPDPSHELQNLATEESGKLRKRILELEEKDIIHRKKIRRLQRVVWQQKKRIRSLKVLTKDLENTDMILEEEECINFIDNREVIKAQDPLS